MKNSYVIEFFNENEFRKKERVLKKYNMLAYKKLIFDYYPSFREGKFDGTIVSQNKIDECYVYELKLPTDKIFEKQVGDIILHYSVYYNQRIVMLRNITPDDILTEGHQKELTTYKGVQVSKSHAEKDMFKINLLNMLEGNNYSSSKKKEKSTKKVYENTFSDEKKIRRIVSEILDEKLDKIVEEKIEKIVKEKFNKEM